MIKHYLTWYGKGEDGLFEGEKKLTNSELPDFINVDTQELIRLKLYNNEFDIAYPVTELEQFKYLAQFINHSFWTDKYDYFLETFIGD